MLCIDSKCSKFKNEKCTIFPEDGVKFRERQGYCPIPDFPKSEKTLIRERAGQQKQVKVKKKK